MSQKIYKRKQLPPKPWALPQFNPLSIEPLPENFQHHNLLSIIDCSKPLDLFSLFITDRLLESLAENTNRYAALYYAQNSPNPHGRHRERPWTDTSTSELKVYIGAYIWMGLHSESDVADFWNTDGTKGPLHPHLTAAISETRWQRLDRFFHISPPKAPNTPPQKPYQKLEPLANHLASISKQLWRPGTHLSIDEAMARCLGRAIETVKVPSKPTPEGFKVWVLADQGYILAWLWHSKGVGPEGLTNYFTKSRGFANTQALVLELATIKDSSGVRLLAENKHHIWLDNLFTTSALLAELRRHSIGASGTVRITSTKTELIQDANIDGDFLLLEASQASIESEVQQESTSIETSQAVSEVASQEFLKPRVPRVHRRQGRKASLVVILKIPNRHPLLSEIREEVKIAKGTGLSQDLINLRKRFNHQIPWGWLYAVLSEDERSIQFAWKDQNVVLFMSSACTGRDLVTRTRRKPAKTSTNASSSRKVFARDEYTKDLEIPSFIDLYNHHMDGVDQQDQLRSYYNTQRQHIKPWKSL